MAKDNEVNIREEIRRSLWKHETGAMKLSSRHRADEVGKLRINYVHIDGMITLAELNAFAADRQIPSDDLNLNWLTMRWTDEASPEEIEADRVEAERVAANRKAWELKTLAELKAKYE